MTANSGLFPPTNPSMLADCHRRHDASARACQDLKFGPDLASYRNPSGECLLMNTRRSAGPINGAGKLPVKIAPRAEHTITRSDLASAVYNLIGITRSEAAAIVDAVFDEMLKKICNGETVKLHNFGKFVIQHKDKREGRNPRTLEFAEISESRIVQFKASFAMKQKLNPALEEDPCAQAGIRGALTAGSGT